ncbi:MAG TPA: VWA domain-containing protein [candidate division Zixibacteria bacterium]|nr:VWA domain-containing protein [candidate division Zixibacteria bacterium]
MFNFLNTSILFAAAAALVPLIIHLFSKRKVTVVEFSSVRHLKAMQKRQVRKLKIRQLLLLLLRMLIIFVAVLAFARPTTESGSIGSHASVSAVILFDNSASMNRYVTNGQLFDIAKKRTEQLLDSFEESDQILLIPLVGSENQFLEFQSKAVAQEILENTTIHYEFKTLQSSLSIIKQLFDQTSNLNKELYIVTDFQRTILPDSSILKDVDVSLFFVELPLEDNKNLTVSSVNFGGQLILPGHDFTISTEIHNQGQEQQTDIIASLILDGSRIAQTDFSIDASSDKTIRFIRSVSSTGFHSGYVEISDDKFQLDNRFYFSFKIPNQFNLLIVDGDNTGELIKLALSPSQSIKQYWSVKRATPNELSSVNFWNYDVIFLSGSPKLSDGHLQRLKSFLSQGRSVFITYDGQTDIDFFNKNYSELSGVTFDEPARLDFSKAGYYTFSNYENRHPLFSFYTFKDNKLPEIRFFTLPKMHHSAKSTELMTFTGNRPALIENRYKSGRVLTFTGPLNPQYSDLSAHAFFVPFLSRIAEYLAADLSSYDLTLYSGMPIHRELTDKISINEPITLITPDSTQYDLVPEDNNGTLSLFVEPIDIPGTYTLRYRTKMIDQFSVNLSPLESDLTSSDADQFAKSFGLSAYTLLPVESNLEALLSKLRFGNELWQLFIWLALILLALEMILSKSTKDTSSQ